ncbi:MAG TPA: hypothetical protein VKS98_09250 [Chthoniobacterales bacterium]|nr:hypothetical protein [Chthoniobacterales bacterium]
MAKASALTDTRLIKPFMTTCRGVLFEGDCLEVLRKLRGGIVDCVFADPPFNIGKDYKNNFDDNVDRGVRHLEKC